MFSLKRMDGLIYWVMRGVVGVIQALPLGLVARIGRAGGALAWWLDARHRRVTMRNLTRSFGGEKSAEEIRALGREVFRRIGENYASAVRTAAMTEEEVREVVEVVGAERVLGGGAAEGRRSRVVAIGHFGNFELYARLGKWGHGYRFATTYRGLRQRSLDRLMRELRERSGCLYFERRTESGVLREEMAKGGMMLGLLADQHAGRRGVWGPFMGADCSTTGAPAILALRYGSPLSTAICFRVAPGRWRVEVGEAIPTRIGGVARTVEEITGDMNRAFEVAIRRDPANWFWVHDRWKKSRSTEPVVKEGAEQGAELRIVVRGLNWLGDAVMSTPALMRLREAHRGARITLLIGEKLADLFRSHPAVDEVLSFRSGEGVWAVSRRIRAGAFDLAVVLPNSPRAALEPMLAGVRRRVGLSRGWRDLLLSEAVPAPAGAVRMKKLSAGTVRRYLSRPPRERWFQPGNGAHQVHHYLGVVSAVGGKLDPTPPLIVVSEAVLAGVREKFGLSERAGPWLGLNAGAAYGPAKRWLPERFVEAAIELQRRGLGRWVIVGDGREAEMAAVMAEQIRRGLPPADADGVSYPAPLNLAGRTSLGELSGVLKVCEVVLTNDTGPMHLAAAVGTAVVVPFGSTSPELTGPGLPGDGRHGVLRSSVPCAPCFRRDCPIDLRCMRSIPVAAVVGAFEELCRGRGGRR
jgi:lipopolysaccharide heptosyltransferase II